MHIQSHLMGGWCFANGFTLTPRERLFCIVASIIPDIDGIGIAISEQAYFRWHHVAAHNLPFAIVSCSILTCFSFHRLKSFVVYLSLFHLHLLMDYLGSGPGWGIVYCWPLSRWTVINPYAWPFFSWENIAIAAVFLIWTLSIAHFDRRTPLEAIMLALDRQLVDLLRSPKSVRSKDTDVS